MERKVKVPTFYFVDMEACINPCRCRRFVGTPFPPWDEGTDVWGVQHLLHPDLGEPVFAEWYGSEEMINAVCELLEVKPDELQLGK